ncbi:MAG: LysM peptidoglycan-binding domain-containing protein [Candidatus Omnitrophota bacterium]
MYKGMLLFILGGFLFLVVSGCIVRTYPVIKERADQELSEGNRGYLMGKPKVTEGKKRKTTREVQVIEFEFYPIKTEPAPQMPVSKVKEAPPVYVMPGPGESGATTSVIIPEINPVVIRPAKSKTVVIKKYTVKEGDTLQRISKQFYGTTKRWEEIYKLNQKILKSPHSIYPGQVIEVAVEETSGTK